MAAGEAPLTAPVCASQGTDCARRGSVAGRLAPDRPLGDVVAPVAGGEFGPLHGFASADVGEDGCGYLSGQGEHGCASGRARVDALFDEDAPDGFGSDGPPRLASGEEPRDLADAVRGGSVAVHVVHDNRPDHGREVPPAVALAAIKPTGTVDA